MCELLGMSARHPTDLNASLALLRPRGGQVGPHSDGWGVAFYEGRAARIFKEPIPAVESRCLAFIAEEDYRSTIVIGHIRRANPSAYGRSSANTHPFTRELFGQSWVFAHNGKLQAVKEDARFALHRFHPTGDTDSEHAFCYLLDRLAEAHEGALDTNGLVSALRRPVEALSGLGELNFLMSDGVHLIAFANSKLHQVKRTCVEHACNQQVIVLTTEPLTAEAWLPTEQNRLHVFVDGQELAVAANTPLAATTHAPGAGKAT